MGVVIGIVKRSLAASSGVDLRLDCAHAAAQSLVNLHRLINGKSDSSFGHGDLVFF